MIHFNGLAPEIRHISTEKGTMYVVDVDDLLRFVVENKWMFPTSQRELLEQVLKP